MNTSALDQCVQKMLTMSTDIHHGLKSIKDLDHKYQNTHKKLRELRADYINRSKPTKQRLTEKQITANEKLEKQVISLHDQCIAFSKSKVDIAAQSYDMIDKNIEMLDDELKKFEDDLKSQADNLAALQGNTRKSKLSQKLTAKNKIKLKASERNMINNAISQGNDILEAANTPVDKNEPRYCICNGVSFGEMIKCDNDWCEKEWFHFSCIGIDTKNKMKGKWYCKDCRKDKEIQKSKN